MPSLKKPKKTLHRKYDIIFFRLFVYSVLDDHFVSEEFISIFHLYGKSDEEIAKKVKMTTDGECKLLKQINHSNIQNEQNVHTYRIYEEYQVNKILEIFYTQKNTLNIQIKTSTVFHYLKKERQSDRPAFRQL